MRLVVPPDLASRVARLGLWMGQVFEFEDGRLIRPGITEALQAAGLSEVVLWTKALTAFDLRSRGGLHR